jgi:hypothetical protein
LNYHKETKLLIAFGEPKDLNTINNVLNTLPAQKAVQTQSELDSIKVELHMTERRVEELMKKVQVSKTDTTSEEKSGK